MAITKKTNAKKLKISPRPIKKKTAIKSGKSALKKTGKSAPSGKIPKKETEKSKAVKKKTATKKSKTVNTAKKSATVTKRPNDKPRQVKPKNKPESGPAPSETVNEVKTVREQSLELADRIARLMFEKKAENIIILDLGNLTSVMDCFIIASGTSDVHVRAIADHVADRLELEGVRPHHKEGFESQKWILLDYIDVVVHVFQKETREFYSLERLWGDARTIKMDDRA